MRVGEAEGPVGRHDQGVAPRDLDALAVEHGRGAAGESGALGKLNVGAVAPWTRNVIQLRYTTKVDNLSCISRQWDVSNADFGILLGLAFQRFVNELNEHLAAKGFQDIKPTFGYVLRALADQRRTTAQLAARLGVTSQGMAKIIAEMQAAGIVTAHADPADARLKLLDLSPRGRRMLKAAREFHRDFERRLGDQAPAIRAALTDLATPDGLDRPLRLPA